MRIQLTVLRHLGPEGRKGSFRCGEVLQDAVADLKLRSWIASLRSQ
jgi:hypothetical protein